MTTIVHVDGGRLVGYIGKRLYYGRYSKEVQMSYEQLLKGNQKVRHIRRARQRGQRLSPDRTSKAKRSSQFGIGSWPISVSLGAKLIVA